MSSILRIKTSPQAPLHRNGDFRSRAPSLARRRSERKLSVVNANKKGVGTFYFDHNNKSLAELRPEASWYYTWSSSPSNVSGSSTSTDGGGLDFVPMIWGVHHDWNQKGEDNRWIEDELKRLDPHATTLLGYNEPDGKNQGQSDIDVATAVDNWWKLEQTNMRLGSPATAERATKEGGWMERFMDEVDKKKLRVDFMCVHFYPGYNTSMTDSDSAAQELADYVIAVHEKYKRPIWLTEFAYIDYNHGGTRYPEEQKQVDFARTAVYKLEHLDFVERYAWYALPNTGAHGENNGLFWGDGKMSYVGTAYKYAHN